MQRSERQFQNEVIKWLRSVGCYVYKNAQNQYTEVGRPDLTVCVPAPIKRTESTDFIIGIYVGIELKREDEYNHASHAQEIVGRQIQKAGGHFYVIDNLQTLKDIVESIQRGIL